MRVAVIRHPTGDATAVPMCPPPAGVEVVVIQPAGDPVIDGVETVGLTVLGAAGSRLVRYAALGSALAGAGLVRVHADPGSALAVQVARACRKSSARPALVIEVDHVAGRPAPIIWQFVVRSVLRRADAVIARHTDGLARLRRAGFHGVGLIAGAVQPGAVPNTAIRAGLRSGPLTLGIAPSPLTRISGAVDLLEAVAASPGTMLLAVALDNHQRLADRAAALGMADRLRFVDHAAMLSQIDVLVAVPHSRAAYRLPYDRLIAATQMAHVPVVCSNVAGLPEVTGPGGWVVPPGDAGALFELLRTTFQNRGQLAACGARAAQHQRLRQGERLDAAGLCQVTDAAARARRGTKRVSFGPGAKPAVQP